MNMHTTSMLLRNLTHLRSLLRVVVPGVLVLSAVLACRLLTNGFFPPQDEGIFLAYPDLILRGYVPYKDFAALYPPAGFYLLAGAFGIFGETISVERSLGAAYWFMIVLGIFFIGSRVNRVTAALAAMTALAYLSLTGELSAYPHLGGYACMLFALVLASREFGNNTVLLARSALLSGVVAGIALWFKQDLGVLAIAATLVAIDPWSPHRLRPFLAGVAIPTCAIVVFAIIVGPVQTFDSLVLDVIRSGPGRFVPFHPRWDLGVIAACVIVQCVIAARMHGPGVSQQLVWLARGMATLSLGHSLLSLHRTGPGDIGYYGFLVFSLTLVSVSILLRYLAIGPGLRVAATVAVFIVGLLPAGIQHRINGALPKIDHEWVSSGARRVPVMRLASSKGSDLQNLLYQINKSSRSGQGLFVGPSDLRFTNYNDTFIYYLLPQLRPVSRYLEMNPGCANRLGSGLAEEISRADWLILTTRYGRGNEPNASILPGSEEPNDVVRARFCLRSQYGAWTLLQRCPLVTP